MAKCRRWRRISILAANATFAIRNGQQLSRSTGKGLVKIRRMSDQQATEKLVLADGTVSLYRNVRAMIGAEEVTSVDRMIVDHITTGGEEDVVVIQESGKPRIKRVVQHLQIQTLSQAVPTTGGVAYSFADVDTDTEARLLAIYKMFPQESATKAGN